MKKDYWLEVTIKEADNEDDPGYAGGGRVKLSYSDDDLRQILKINSDFILNTIVPMLRKRDHIRELKEAEPFWKKWLGGV